MKKLLMILSLLMLAGLPLACANRDFSQPVSPIGSNGPNSQNPQPTPTP